MAQELKRLNGFGNFDKFGGYYDAEDVDAILAEKDSENESLLQQNRKLKHALWLARAERALEKIADYIVLKNNWSSGCSELQRCRGLGSHDEFFKAIEKELGE